MLRLFGILFLIGIIIFTINQIVIPLWKNLPTFPIFNNKKKELQSIITNNNSLIEDKVLLTEVAKQNKVLKTN
jgi:hypothetical protein